MRTIDRKHEATRRTAIIIVAACLAVLVAAGLWNATSMPATAGAPPLDAVRVFTFVKTGIVYVDPDTSRILWRDKQSAPLKIGVAPWDDSDREPAQAGSLPWAAHREIVGNPDFDVVAWIETVDHQRGDMVVVEASTGTVRARTPVVAPLDRFVVIASVDEEAVYFATTDPAAGIPDVPDEDIWMWRWASGERPRPVRLLAGRYHNDVSAGIWAVYERDGVSFRDLDGQTRSFSEVVPAGRTDFGGALSPDGRYWYPEGTSQIIDTATGEAVTIGVSADRAYGWTGAGELTMTRSVLVSCSARSGRCMEPLGLPPAGVPIEGVCAGFGLACRDKLPVN